MSKASAQKSAALPEPATIYVLWHPPRDPAEDCAEFYAHAIFSWFRMKSGYGAPVYFRSTAAAARDGKPLDILPPAKGAVNLIVVLANAEMVADHAWRAWLDELAARPEFLLFPVALDSTAYNLPESMRELNFIPVHSAAGRGAQVSNDDRELGRARLLKQLTEAFARVLTREQTDSAAALPSESKVRVFLSHAKADDTEQARSLRDYIYSETQLSAFFDENDIAFGNSFQKVLDKALRQGETAALAVFHGDNYADRPWCRREIQVFRKPVKVKGAGCVWMLHPMLVLQTMKGGISGGVGLGRTIAELGSATCIRWQERNEAIYVTSLLREVFLGARHLKMAIEVKRRLRRMHQRIAKSCALINWTPDLPTLLRLGEIIRDEAGGVSLSRVIYPGHGLSRLELDTLRLYFPKLELRTFTEVLS